MADARAQVLRQQIERAASVGLPTGPMESELEALYAFYPGIRPAGK